MRQGANMLFEARHYHFHTTSVESVVIVVVTVYKSNSNLGMRHHLVMVGDR